VGPPFEKPSDVVQWFGAVQAQDDRGSLWAKGLNGHFFTRQRLSDVL
jgi:hypothetical protein